METELVYIYVKHIEQCQMCKKHFLTTRKVILHLCTLQKGKIHFLYHAIAMHHLSTIICDSCHSGFFFEIWCRELETLQSKYTTFIVNLNRYIQSWVRIRP